MLRHTDAIGGWMHAGKEGGLCTTCKRMRSELHPSLRTY